MTESVTKYFTAHRLAQLLGVSKKRVLQLLLGVNPTTVLPMHGGSANAWSYSALPLAIQKRLENLAQQKGYRNPEQMAASQEGPWMPTISGREVSHTEVAERHVTRAIILRKELQPVMEAEGEEGRTKAIEHAAKALNMSERHVRRLIDRTAERDRGFNNFGRLEIYLEERISFRVCPEKVDAVKAFRLPEPISEVLKHLENPYEPTPGDIREIWLSILEHYKSVRGQEAQRAFKRAEWRALLNSVLLAVPNGLSRNLEAFERLFYSKVKKFDALGAAALEDRRKEASGNFRRPDFKEDLLNLKALAVQYGGNEDLAHREAFRLGKLSKAYLDYYGVSAESGMPETVRSEISNDVNILQDYHHGPRQHMLNRAAIPRDWSKVAPGDWFSADDVTWPIYFLATDQNGEVLVTRGECLVMIDLRTGYVLDFVLIIGKYTSRHIRKLTLKVHDRHGLPRRGLYFERGVWASRYLIGDDTPEREHVHWRETAMGLKEQGVILEMRHARLPRAKTIEGLLGILQNKMEALPGYVGRNEMVEKFERVQKNIRLAKGGVLAAIKKMYTYQEWVRELSRIFTEYNNETQFGQMLQRKSPADAWGEQGNLQPLKQLHAQARFLLATNKRPVTVTKRGIRLTIGGRPYWYFDKQVAPLENKEVLTWFNADYPEFITVTDMERKNPITVERVLVDAMDGAETEAMKKAKAAQAGFLGYAREMYGEIKHRFAYTITRDNEHSKENKELGAFISRQEEALTQAKAQHSRKVGRARVLANELNQPLPASIENPDRLVRSLELEREAEEELKRLSANKDAQL